VRGAAVVGLRPFSADGEEVSRSDIGSTLMITPEALSEDRSTVASGASRDAPFGSWAGLQTGSKDATVVASAQSFPFNDC